MVLLPGVIVRRDSTVQFMCTIQSQLSRGERLRSFVIMEIVNDNELIYGIPFTSVVPSVLCVPASKCQLVSAFVAWRETLEAT